MSFSLCGFVTTLQGHMQFRLTVNRHHQ